MVLNVWLSYEKPNGWLCLDRVLPFTETDLFLFNFIIFLISGTHFHIVCEPKANQIWVKQTAS